MKFTEATLVTFYFDAPSGKGSIKRFDFCYSIEQAKRKFAAWCIFHNFTPANVYVNAFA